MRTVATCTRGHMLVSLTTELAPLTVTCGHVGLCAPIALADLGYAVSIDSNRTVFRAYEFAVTHEDGTVTYHGGTDRDEAMDTVAHDLIADDFPCTVTDETGRTFTGVLSIAGEGDRQYVMADPHMLALIAA